MRYLPLFFSLFLSFNQATAQNLLKPKWKFTTGDEVAWASQEFDDRKWEELLSGEMWEQQGYSTYDGYGWYRQTVFIPKKLEANARNRGGLALNLGKIDDADVTYWNGEVLDGMGGMPPDYHTAYDEERAYFIPMEKIRFGEKNLVAVRVYDAGGGGGLHRGTVSLHVPGMDELLVMKLRGIPANHTFLNSQPVALKLELSNKLDEAVAGHIKWAVTTDFGKPVHSSSDEIRVGEGKTAIAVCKLEDLAAGFYQASVILKVPPIINL